ncbi:hypothetical protein E9232_003711 [Inquilinus ginsengisoli]|uniref:SIR2-like domain-containing protein n=1 Tax=Inquilinus ginsengisoli TaxID=363840 RepID=A0ABU1JRD0_9PROT|nr:hypothetical protein [Inquilinus ginsengisoli]MDR6291185.1 hypothetical protein [Inquilinus ginsengisoli]
MLGQAALAFVGGEAFKSISDITIKHYGPTVLSRLDRMIKDWKKADHPSLNDVRQICDHLEKFLIKDTPARGVDIYKFPKPARGSAFTRDDMTPGQIADLWFRTNTKIWKDSISPLAEKWGALLDNASMPYFRGTGDCELNYSHRALKPSDRHPIFRNIHPFIMISSIRRDKLRSDPIEEVMEFFIDGWKIFSDSDYTVFRRGTVLRLANQGFAEGVFTVTNRSAFWSGSVRREEVQLWRCIVVTGYTNTVKAMNIGIPMTPDIGRDYIGHVQDWMTEFRVLLDE